jgi:hypothetical protein
MPRIPISRPRCLAALAGGVLLLALAGCAEEDPAAAAGPLAPPASVSSPTRGPISAERLAERLAELEAALDAARATPEQRARIDALIADARASHRPAGLRRAIGEVLTPEQRQAMRESWRARHGEPGAFLRAHGERLASRLELGEDQRREIQRLIADFRGKHEGEIAALRVAVERLGDDWVAGNWHEDRPEGVGEHVAEDDPRAAVRTVRTPEQAAKLRGHRLHLLRRLLAGTPARSGG